MSVAKAEVSTNDVKLAGVVDDTHILEPRSLFARVFLPVLNVLRDIKIRRRERSMRLCETLPLGEKRFLAIVQIEQQRFLIAATNQSVSLLHCLEGPDHQAAGSSVDCQDGIR